jgi:4-hydroxybenzoate polyprenyltransferase
MTDQKPYSLSSFAFWKAYWVTLRPYLFFISSVSGLVGLAIPDNIGWYKFTAAFLAFFFSYGLGQALTDVTQIDTDSISSPYRPLTQGLITGRQVLGVSLTGLLTCAALLLWCNPWNLLYAVIAIIGLATYTFFKRRWWGGPFWNSWIVGVLVIMGYHCGEPDPRVVFQSKILWAAVGSVFFSYAIFVLLGYFKDISADRQTGYNTLPVKVGWVPSVWISVVFNLGAVASSLIFIDFSGYIERIANFQLADIVAGAMWALGVICLFGSHALMLRTRDEAKAFVSIGFVVRGYVLFHLGEVMIFKPALVLHAVIFYLFFEITLAIRPEKSQI